jgi:hypothetical protein
VNSLKRIIATKKPDCASAPALKVPELKGQAGIMKVYELVEKKQIRRFGRQGERQAWCVV